MKKFSVLGRVLTTTELKRITGGNWSCTATCGSSIREVNCSGPCFETTDSANPETEGPYVTDVYCNGQRTTACPFA